MATATYMAFSNLYSVGIDGDVEVPGCFNRSYMTKLSAANSTAGNGRSMSRRLNSLATLEHTRPPMWILNTAVAAIWQ